VTPQEAIEAAELVEAETRYRLRLACEMFEAGRQAAEADMAQQWSRAAAAVCGPACAELEERRWGPGGRAHFADPRPGDFPGVKKEAERELDAGLHGRARGPSERRV
jgi:hypothetical protein